MHFHIDQPPTDAFIIEKTLIVSGWVFNPKVTFTTINIYVDNELLDTISCGLPRPDVLEAFPDVDTALVGYQGEISLTNLANGKHELLVEACAKKAPPYQKRIPFILSKGYAVIKIDTPAEHPPITAETLSIRGWGFWSESTVKEVVISLDGKQVATAQYGLARPDVPNAYPVIVNPNVGYEALLDAKTISEGKHLLEVKLIMEDGHTLTETRQFILLRQMPSKQQISIASPNPLTPMIKLKVEPEFAFDIEPLVDQTYLQLSSVVPIQGWIKREQQPYYRIEFFIGDVFVGELDLSRPLGSQKNTSATHDVSLTQFTGEIIVPADTPLGRSTLRLVFYTNSGYQKRAEQTIYIGESNFVHFLDRPQPSDSLQGMTDFYGWVYSKIAPIARVEVFHKGKLLGQLEHGNLRSDVSKAGYMHPAALLSGYTGKVYILEQPTESTPLQVRAYDTLGSSHVLLL